MVENLLRRQTLFERRWLAPVLLEGRRVTEQLAGEVRRLHRVLSPYVVLLAGVAAGAYRSLEEAVAATVRPVKTYEPNPERARYYDDQFARYRSLYPLLSQLKKE